MLENPGPNSYQSGIGVISGWACDAESIEIEFQHGTTRTVTTFIAGYGTSRGDTMGVCEDGGNNGFSLLYNWNILGDGEHTVRALADGVEFARRTFTVSTLNSEEFAKGLSGGFVEQSKSSPSNLAFQAVLQQKGSESKSTDTTRTVDMGNADYRR